MSDIQHHPQMVYANALAAKGILASWTYSCARIIVGPQVTSSENPEERIPFCVEYMTDDQLHAAFNKNSREMAIFDKQLDKNFKDMSSNLNQATVNFGLAIINCGTLAVLNNFAASSVKWLQYSATGLALWTGSRTVLFLRDHFKASSERKQNLIAYEVLSNNAEICVDELGRRGIDVNGVHPI